MTGEVKPARVPTRIMRECVNKHSAGSCWRHWRVRLPAGIVMQDLQDFPDMWRAVQSDRNTAMSRDDRVTLFADDRSWAVDCVVMDADPGKVALSKPTVLWSGRDAGMGIAWQDDKFEIEFNAGGYAVYRKAVGNRSRDLIRDGFPSLTPAKALVAKQYPRQVA